MKQFLRPLSDWLALLGNWQSLSAFAAVLLYEMVPLFSPEYQLIAQSFDGIDTGQLYFDHGVDPSAWIAPLVTMAGIQAFLARSLVAPVKAPPWPRLWLWGLLSGLAALNWGGVVLLVDRIALAWADGGVGFDFLLAETIAISTLSVALLPVAMWQIAALQSGPRQPIAALLRGARPDWPGWLSSFALLQAGLVGMNALTERAALGFFSGQPLLGYLLPTIWYSFNLVAVVLFQIAAYRRLTGTHAPWGAVFD